MRHLAALLPLLAACSSDPAPPTDASAADVTAVDANDAAGSGTCPEGQRWCGATSRNDLCFQVGSAGSVLGCVTDPRMPPCDLPPPCGSCAAGARIWRRADLAAHSAARADSGVCPDYGDAGVPVATIRE